jgi:hypothetical protein
MGWTDLPPKNPLAAALAVVETAHGTLAELQQRRGDAVARQAEIAAEREGLAFDAAVGDKAARKSLNELNQRSLQLGLDIENLDAAIVEARRRIGVAEAAAHLEKMHERARAVRLLLEDQRKSGDKAEQALEIFVTELGQVYSANEEMRRLVGGIAPGRDLIRVHATRAIQSALYRVQLNTDVVPPNERHSLDYYITRWAEQIEARLTRMLGEAGEAE